MRIIRLFLTCAALLATLTVTACANSAARADAAGATPGVTVYGTADGGVGRVAR